jgi:hypothetical protein
MHRNNLSLEVPRRWLLLIAGALWTVAGVILCWRAGVWLAADGSAVALPLELIGLMLAIPFYTFCFVGIVRKSIARIDHLPERASIFAFSAVRGYFMIGGMIALGVALRSSPIPRDYLAVPYTAMGGTLLLASSRFYKRFWKTKTNEQ